MDLPVAESCAVPDAPAINHGDVPVRPAAESTEPLLPDGDLAHLRLFLIGIGGCGMSGLARMLQSHGATVAGSDGQANATTEALRVSGIPVCKDHESHALLDDADLVVASAAIPDEHPQLATARARGARIARYPALLGALMARRDGVAIAGTHGKSTTTAWLSYLLRESGVDPSFVVGATTPQLGGGSGVGEGTPFIAEACEYRESFLDLAPRRAIILNVDEDHLDYYRDLTEIQAAFARFVARLPSDGLLVLNGDDEKSAPLAASAPCRVTRVGLSINCDWRATKVRVVDGHYHCLVTHDRRPIGEIALGIPGEHNLHNALAVIAIAHDLGVKFDKIQAALGSFRGIGRRLEQRGVHQNVRVIDDYAHHPTEIKATLATTRATFRPRRLWCIFQPHQHSRTRFLLEDFARTLTAADEVLVPDIFFVRDSEREREAVAATDLVEQVSALGGSAAYLPAFKAIVDRLVDEVAPGDVVVTMGAGNIWKVADELVQRLREPVSD